MEEATLTFEEQILRVSGICRTLNLRNCGGVLSVFTDISRHKLRLWKTWCILDPKTSAQIRQSLMSWQISCANVEEMASTASRLAALFDHTQAPHAYKQGQNSYVLSIIAAIFLPLGFLTGLFGVNVASIPGL